MNTQWGSWLKQLHSDKALGVILPAILRGRAYAVEVTFDTNLTVGTVTAGVDSSPNSDGNVLAEFAVSVGAFADGTTPVTLSLTQTQVDALPPDGDGDGLNELLYQIDHAPAGGQPLLIAAGQTYVLESVR